MDGPTLSLAPISNPSDSVSENVPSIVFQPQKLTAVIDIVNLMGTVSQRIREENAGDLPAMRSTKSSGTGGNTTTRDDAIAKAPPVAMMQQKLMQHLKQERSLMQRQAKTIASSNAPGAAWTLTELYKKIRSLSSLIAQILEASAEMIKRFYVSVFIDRQPLTVTGGSIAQADQ
jgi:hypothetical protein